MQDYRRKGKKDLLQGRSSDREGDAPSQGCVSLDPKHTIASRNCFQLKIL